MVMDSENFVTSDQGIFNHLPAVDSESLEDNSGSDQVTFIDE